MTQQSTRKLTVAEIKVWVDTQQEQLPPVIKDRYGKCFKYTEDFATNYYDIFCDVNCVVVHGYHYCRRPTNPNIRGKIGHGWILFKDCEYIYDPTFGVFDDDNPRYEPVYTYTFNEIIKLHLVHMCYGAWEPLETLQIIPDDEVFPFDF